MLYDSHQFTHLYPPLNCELPKDSDHAVFDFLIPPTYILPDFNRSSLNHCESK